MSTLFVIKTFPDLHQTKSPVTGGETLFMKNSIKKPRF
jgi:hypothetical protein